MMTEIQDPHFDIIRINGGSALLFGICRYYRHKIYKNGSSIWRCSTYKNTKCCGSITIAKDIKTIITQKDDTNCVADTHSNAILKEKCNLRESVVASDKPIQRLYESKKRKFYDQGLNLAINDFPPYESVKHFLHDARNKSAQISKTKFKNVKEVEVPAQFQNFILANYFNVESDKQTLILVFSSYNSRKIILDVKEYFMDGTFYTCPAPFVQLYNIHGDMSSSVETTKVKPLIFALMSDRAEKSYMVLFNLIQSQLPDWKPQKIHCDYDIAPMKAILKLFPDIVLKGCYYHIPPFDYSQTGRGNILTRNLKKVKKIY